VGKQIVDRANLSRDQFGPIFEALGISDVTDDEGIVAGLAACRAEDADGAKRRRALEEAIQLKHYEFNAHGVELNQRYASTAVLDDGTPAEQWPRDSELYHQASTRPGAKLPHAWLVGADGHRLSTLDLVGHGSFTLLTGLSGKDWDTAADRCRETLDVPLRVVHVGSAEARDAYGEWSRLSEIAEDGCLLVRPDGYIAHRWPSTPDSPDAVRDVLTTVLTTV
jgi:2,4-dichlorophenol 6-monooxygenase